MSALDHPPGTAAPPSSMPASLTAGHASVLLDALDHLRILLRRGVQPWADYADTGPTDSMTTEAGYRDLLDTAGAALTTLLEAQPEAVLVAHTADEARAYAALNLRTYPPAAEDGDRSPRIVVDLHGVTVDVQRRADHTAVDLNTDDVPDEYTPVRVNLGDTELTDPYAPAPARTQDTEAGR
jgi:hypothetical protein